MLFIVLHLPVIVVIPLRYRRHVEPAAVRHARPMEHLPQRDALANALQQRFRRSCETSHQSSECRGACPRPRRGSPPRALHAARQLDV